MKRIFTSIFLSFLPLLTIAQYQPSNSIYGDVTSNGAGLPFINVYVSGTTIGTTTNNDGQFKLSQIPKGKITLVAQGVGFKAKSIALVNNSAEPMEVSFHLEEDVLNLEDVVVTVDRNTTFFFKSPKVKAVGIYPGG